MSSSATLRYPAFCTVNAQNTNACLLVSRADTPFVYVLDTVLPANVEFIQLSTHVYSANENTVRPVKVILKGEGVITGGAAILVCDNIRYQLTEALLLPSNPNTDTLLEVNFQGDQTAREWYVIFALSGYNINIRSTIPEWTVQGL